MSESTESQVPPRRFKLWHLCLVPLFCVAGATSLWMKMRFPSPPPRGTDIVYTNGQEYVAPPISLFVRYMSDHKPREEDLTDELIRVLDRLAEQCSNLEEDIDRTEAELRAADPHLDQALRDPIGTPFLDPNSVSVAELRSNCRPITEAIVDDFVLNSGLDANVVAELEPTLRSVLYAIVAITKVDEQEKNMLLTSFKGGVKDPLLLACLMRVFEPGSKEAIDGKFTNVLFAQRDERKLSLQSKVFVYCSFPKSWNPDVIAETIQTFADLSQWIASEQRGMAIESFFFKEIRNCMLGLNFPALADLLIELDKRKEPAAQASIVQFVASEVVGEIARTYRGDKFISETLRQDLEKFDDFATRSDRHLAKAWTLAPYEFVIAGKLMSLQQSSGNTSRSMDEWFRFSMAFVSDSNIAFDVYMNSLQAKWGGTNEKQLWFAEKCVLAERSTPDLFFRCDLPLMIRMWENAFTENTGTNLRMVRLAKTYVKQLKMFSQNELHPQATTDSLVSMISILWQAGCFEELDWLVPLCSERLECERLHPFRIHRDEIKSFSAQAVTSRSTCWRDIHSYLQGDTRELSVDDLDGLDMALAQARDEVTDSPVLNAALESYEGRSKTLRRLFAGEEVIFTEKELRDWYSSFRLAEDAFGTTPTTNAGYFQFSINTTGYDARLTLPFQFDPPFKFSADFEWLPDEAELSPDPFGVSLLAGPACPNALLSDLIGPILTISPTENRATRDHLPYNDREEGSEEFKTMDLKGQMAKYALRLDTFPDGYRTYVNNERWEAVTAKLDTAGQVQVGRYCCAPNNLPYFRNHKYRISNIRLQRLDTASVLD